MRTRTLFTLAFVFLTSVGLVLANEEVIVQSPYGGGHPFLIVYASPGGGSNRAPGIYTANKKGEWVPIVLGNPTRGGPNQGVLGQFSLCQHTERFEAIAVVDGEVMLIRSAHGDEVFPPLRIGRESTYVRDPNTFEPIAIPKVTRFEDVTYRAFDVASHQGGLGQAIVVSLRNGAEALTFGLLLTADNKFKPLALATEPVLLNRRFYERAHLDSFYIQTDESARFLSPTLLRSLSRERPSDSNGMREVRRLIDRATRLIESGEVKSGGLPPWIPGVSTRTGELTAPQSPIVTIAQDSTTSPLANLSVNLITGEKTTYIKDSKRTTDYTIRGEIDPTPSGSLQLFRIQDSSAFLMRLNQKWFLAFADQPQNPPISLPFFEGQRFDAFSGFLYKLGKTPHFVFSIKATEPNSSTIKSSTHLISLEDTKGVYLLKGNSRINEHFHTTEDLAERIHVRDTINQGSKLAFDALTPPGEIRKSTTPLLDLEATTNERRVFLPGDPLETIAIEGLGRFVRHEISSAFKSFTGIEITGKHHDSKGLFIEGELLERSHEGRQIQILAQEEGTIGHDSEKIRLSVLAIDRNQSGGTKGHGLLLVAESRYALHTALVSLNTPFSDLAGVELIAIPTKQGLDAYLFWNTQSIEVPSQGSVYVQKLTLTTPPKDPSSISFQNDNTIPLSKTPLSRDEILKRILFGEKSRHLYWIHPGQIDRKSPDFGLLDIHGRTSILPNTTREGRSLGLIDLVDYRQKRGGHLDPDSYGFGLERPSWSIYGAWELAREWTEQGYTVEVTDNKIEEKYREIQRSIPELRSTLERFSDPTKPPQINIMIVADKTQKLSLMNHMLVIGKSRQAQNWNFNFDSKMALYFIKADHFTVEDIYENLNEIRKRPRSDRPIIFLDGQLVAVKGLNTSTSPPSHLLTHFLDHNHQPPANVLILATQSEWAQISNSLVEFQESNPRFLDSIHRDYTFFKSDWKLWGPDSEWTTEEIQKRAEKRLSSFESQIIPSLTQELRDFADPSKGARHRVFLVPKELKRFIRELVFNQWAARIDPNQARSTWNFQNPDLAVAELKLDSRNTRNEGQAGLGQDAFLTELEALRGLPHAKRVLLGDLSVVLKSGALSPNEEDFLLTDQALETIHEDKPDSKEARSRKPPHALYLLATEGDLVDGIDFKDHTRTSPKEVSILLVGTEEEWALLKEKTDFENRFGFGDHFEVSRITPPNKETRVRILLDILESSQIRSLGYNYELKGPSGSISVTSDSSDPKEAFLKYLVNRTEAIAHQAQEDSINAFVRLLREFSLALIEDQGARNSRLVNREFAERLLSKVFNIPLNLNILPPEDPLVRLKDESAAALELQGAGYEGALELKVRVIQTILSQTKADPTRQIPSSIIAFGETGTGKTFLFKALVQMLGLKEYRMGSEKNENAQAMIIDCGKIGPATEGSNATLWTAEEVIKEISQFLVSPLGYRGFILFDDIHKTAPEEIGKIMAFVNSLHEAPGGFVDLMGHDGRLRSVPVKNLTLMMTLNPTSDQNLLKRFAPKGTDEELIVASLAKGTFVVEKSVLKRWSLILNLSKFPVGAKAPKLAESFRDAARLEFGSANRLNIATPEVINELANRFHESDAREFLADSTHGLIELSADREGSSVFVLVPRRVEKSNQPDVEIKDYIERQFTAIPIDEDIAGQLRLSEFIVDSYRMGLTETLIRVASSDPRLAIGKSAQTVLSPLLAGLVANLFTSTKIPLDALSLYAEDFGFNDELQKARFREVIETRGSGGNFFGDLDVGWSVEKLMRSARNFFERSTYQEETLQPTNRKSIASEYSRRIKEVLGRYLIMMARVESLETFNQVPDRRWIESHHDEKDRLSKAKAKQLGGELIDIYLDFLRDLYRPSVEENRTGQAFTSEEDAYLFARTIDRALTSLPWGRVTRFLSQALVTSTRALDLAQHTGFQEYIFGSKYSLLWAQSPETLVQLASASGHFKNRLPKLQERLKESANVEAARSVVRGCRGLFAL